MGQNPQELGHCFHNAIKDYLFETIGPQCVTDMGRRDNRAPAQAGGDGGYDFHVTIPEGSKTLFGHPVAPGRRYLIEVKARSGGDLSYQSVSSNLTRIQSLREEFDGVFIVTNTYMAASGFYGILNNFPPLSGKVILVEGDDLEELLPANPANRGFYLTLQKRVKDFSPIEITSSRHDVRYKGNSATTFTVRFKNKSDDAVELNVAADCEGHFRYVEEGIPEFFNRELSDLSSEWSKTLTLHPRQSKAVQVSVTRAQDYGQGSEEAGRFLLSVQHGDNRHPLAETAPAGGIFYTAPFSGTANQQAKEDLQQVFNGRAGCFKILHITGEAGVGKSRMVDEILPEPHRADFAVLHTTLPAAGAVLPDSHWKALRSNLAAHVLDSERNTLPPFSSPESLLETTLGHLQNITTLGGKWSTIVIVLEDMHHASPELCEYIRGLLSSPPSLEVGVTLVLTGRSDDSFINKPYRDLSAELSQSKAETVIAKPLAPLEESCAKGLIRQIIEGIDDAGVGKIFGLSGRIPHHIVQCIEHLMDERLLALTERNTLSITDLQTFGDRLRTLPADMDALFTLRFENLGKSLGLGAQQAVLAAAVFGSHFPPEVCTLEPEVPLEHLVEGLVSRRFFAKKDDKAALQWHHENLLLFFSNHRRESAARLVDPKKGAQDIPSHFSGNAKRICENTSLFSQLPPLTQGDIFVEVGEFKQARGRFQALLEKAAEVQTFSTINTDTVYFPHIDYAVALLHQEPGDKDPKTLWKLLVLKVYTGGYHLGLPHGKLANAYGMRALSRLDLPPQVKRQCALWLKVLTAHLHLDSGFTGTALEHLLHLQHDMQLGRLSDENTEGPQGIEERVGWEMMFDVYNQFRLLYTYMNFRDLAEKNGVLAKRCVSHSKLPALEAMDLGDEALLNLYPDRQKCISLLEEALGKGGTERHDWHSRISLYTAQLYDKRRDASWLEEQAEGCQAFIQDRKADNYFSIIPRVHLLHAVLLYTRACLEKNPDFSAAGTAIEQGLEACTDYSIGFISWQLWNLRAVLSLRSDPQKDYAGKCLETALEQIRKEGLTLMGRGAVISAAPIVLGNYVKYYDKYGAAEGRRPITDLLKELRGFEPYGWKDPEAARAHVRKYHHIILDHKKKPGGLLLDKPTKLAVVVWF